jgi:hypothetical protein
VVFGIGICNNYLFIVNVGLIWTVSFFLRKSFLLVSVSVCQILQK